MIKSGGYQYRLSIYADALDRNLWLYGSVMDGKQEISVEMKRALQATIKELCKAIEVIIGDD